MKMRTTAKIIEKIVKKYKTLYKCKVYEVPDGTVLWQPETTEKIVTVQALDEFDAIVKACDIYEKEQR